MATPGSYSNPAQVARDIKDEKTREAYVQGHDSDGIPEDSFAKDIEKGTESHAQSMTADARTQSDNQSTTQSVRQAEEDQSDPNIVDWDGPDDPANPQNCTQHPLP